ncbi:MAG: CoA transferase, partial [Lautropia sp.]
MKEKPMSPLAGMKVLDLTQIMAGPYCTMVLADLGAEVIKVEKAGKGDDSREMGPYVKGESASFVHINRNKQGIVLNLKDPQGREVLYDLARWADVVVENFRVGVTKSLGVDYETLSGINPRLVYCSISGYGQTGPYSRKGGFDLVAQGLTGMMSMTGEAGGRPLKAGIAVYDIGAGITAVYAILAARIHQMNTGEGQHVDISLAECGLPWFIWEAAAFFTNGTVPMATGSRHRVSAPYQAFLTGGGYIVIGAANQRTWQRLCTGVLGRPELITDPRFATNSDRLTHVDELEELLEQEFRKADAATWIARCEESGVPCGPINNFAQALDDPHFKARNMVEEVDHPILGRMKMLGIPTKFSRTPGSVN